MPPSAPAPEHDRATNVILWIALAATSLLVGGYFLVRVYRHLGLDAGLAVLGLLGRTAVYTSAGLALEGLLLRAGDRSRRLGRGRRVALHAAWIGVMLLCVGLVVDLLVFAFAGYHLTTGARILFSGGPQGVGQVIEATGLSPALVAGSVGGAAAGLAAAVWLSRLTRRLSARAGLVVQRRAAFRALFVSLGALAVLEAVSYNARNPFLWEREIRSVPLAFSIARPAADLASFRVSLRRPPSARERAAAVDVAPLARKPDVILFVVESLRRDAVTPAIMPRLSAFSDGAWTFDHAITTGNVTHYSWYGLFCAELPVFFEAVRPAPAEHGSVPLTILRRLGYRTHLFATPDTEYQDLQDVVFGDGESLLDEKFHPPAKLVAERDRAVIDAFVQAMAGRPRGGGVYVVALDSSHFDYAWGAEFHPRFTPFAASASIVQGYQVDAAARRALVNRYRNGLAWVDALLGRAFDALQASGRLDTSYVVVTGDHGEAFWEHGSGTHGTDLSREQLEVGFAMRLPGEGPRRLDGVFSLLDVMPTVLRGLGFARTDLFQGVPVQDRLPPGGAAGGALAPRSALTFQGWNERAYRFALTSARERMIFELDRRDPLRSRRLAVKAVTDLDDASLVDAEGRDAEGSYERVIRELPRAIDALPFLAP
jgi:glucan phosphoethanolaminetransferase (alkaline phosphatase superfamily)